MAIEKIEYQAGNTACIGRLIYDERVSGRRPLLLMAPNWLGVSEEAIRRTQMMCGDRYIGFVTDMFGGGRSLTGPDEAAPLANALRGDASERRRRIKAALDALIGESDRRGIGDSARKAAVGFCFGGGNVLELARAGADLQAVICLHGDLTTPMPAGPGDVRPALLVLHGSKDPVAPKSERDTFEAEMDAAGAKWQMLIFGGLVHSFSESEASLRGLAEYNESAARQSYRLLDRFIQDAFGGLI